MGRLKKRDGEKKVDMNITINPDLKNNVLSYIDSLKQDGVKTSVSTLIEVALTDMLKDKLVKRA